MTLRNGYQSATDGHTRRADFDLLRRIRRLELAIPDGDWDGTPLRLGSYHLWVDATGDLRIKNSAPVSDLDGTVIGTQS